MLNEHHLLFLPYRILPHCIKHFPGIVLDVVLSNTVKHCPGVVLDVILSTTVKHVHVDSPMSTLNLTLIDGRTDGRTDAPILASTEDKAVEVLHFTPPLGDTPTGDVTSSKVPDHAKVAPLIAKPEFESTVIHQL
ncbi:hypothetical protein BGZ58_006408, partial [Dissophora ornata]